MNILGAEASPQTTASILHFDEVARCFHSHIEIGEVGIRDCDCGFHTPHCYPQKDPEGHNLCSVIILHSHENSIFISTNRMSKLIELMSALECMNLQKLGSLSF